MGHSSDLIDFYRGSGSDNRNRFLDEIMKWDYDALENVHDFIQWLFPLKERSAFNRSAPVLTPDDIQVFRNSEELKESLTKSFDLMLDFYGFHRRGLAIERADNYEGRIRNWVNQGNHNYLRITRILKCLCLLDLQHFAKAFLLVLGEVYSDHKEQVGISHSYWKSAVK